MHTSKKYTYFVILKSEHILSHNLIKVPVIALHCKVSIQHWLSSKVNSSIKKKMVPIIYSACILVIDIRQAKTNKCWDIYAWCFLSALSDHLHLSLEFLNTFHLLPDQSPSVLQDLRELRDHNANIHAWRNCQTRGRIIYQPAHFSSPVMVEHSEGSNVL